MNARQITPLCPSEMQSVRGGFLLALLAACTSGGSSKSFDKGCTVGNNPNVGSDKANECESADNQMDDGDGPNSGTVQGK